MTQKSWHTRVVDALSSLGKNSGATLLKPSRIFLRTSEGTAIEYKPDVIWAWGRKRLQLAILEVENGPSTKTVVGDIALATMLANGRTEIYTSNKRFHRFGSKVRKDIEFTDIWDGRARSPRHVVRKGSYRVNQPKSVYLGIVFRDQWARPYFGRYVELLARGRSSPFEDSDVVICKSGSETNAKKSLSKSSMIHPLLSEMDRLSFRD